LGGAVASYIAAHFSDKIDALIMIDALGPLSYEAIELAKHLEKSMQDFVTAEQRPAKNYDAFETMLELRAKVNGLDPQAVRALVERAVIKTEAGYRWRFDPRLRLPSLSYLKEAQVLTMLNAIKAPTLVIQATAGILANTKLVNRRKKAIVDLTFERLPGGHHLHLSHPKAVAQVILTFLASHITSRG